MCVAVNMRRNGKIEGLAKRIRNSLVVYVCHRYRGDAQTNSRAVVSVCRSVAMSGAVPLAPQLFLPQFLDELTERDRAIECCLRFVSLVDEVWVFGKVSEGMRKEIAEANRLGIPVVVGDREALGGGGVESLWSAGRTRRAATRTRPQVSDHFFRGKNCHLTRVSGESDPENWPNG